MVLNESKDLEKEVTLFFRVVLLWVPELWIFHLYLIDVISISLIIVLFQFKVWLWVIEWKSSFLFLFSLKKSFFPFHSPHALVSSSSPPPVYLFSCFVWWHRSIAECCEVSVWREQWRGVWFMLCFSFEWYFSHSFWHSMLH